MLTTTAFVASFEFVVWTVSLSINYKWIPAIQSLHLSVFKTDLARDCHTLLQVEVSPNLTGYTYRLPV